MREPNKKQRRQLAKKMWDSLVSFNEKKHVTYIKGWNELSDDSPAKKITERTIIKVIRNWEKMRHNGIIVQGRNTKCTKWK